MAGKKIYHQDTGQEIGDLLGQGDLVALPVGSDKNRQLVITEWGKKLVKKHGTAGIFSKQLLDGNVAERVEEVLNTVFLSLDKTSIQKPRSKKRLIFKEIKKQEESPEKPKRNIIEVNISGKQKTCLKDIWKVFYLDWKTKQTGYFLVNEYQRESAFNDLEIGSIQTIYLINGYKHQFLSRLC